MSGLLADRDELAGGIGRLLALRKSPREVADALFATGAVRDVATLADDEALVERVAMLTRTNHLACDETTVTDVFTALAAALAEPAAAGEES